MRKLLGGHLFLIILLLTGLISSPSFAQQTNSRGDSFIGSWRLTVGGGPSVFFGDIKQNPVLPTIIYQNQWQNELRFNANLMLERSLSPAISLRGQALYAHVAGYKNELNTYFYSPLYEVNMNMALNLSNIISGYRSDRGVNINLIGGIGLINYNTTRINTTTNDVILIRGFGAGRGVDGMTLETVLMGGIGFDFRLGERTSLRIESAMRGMNSDMFDIHEGGFPFDMYNQTTIGLSYTFGRAMKKVPPTLPEVKKTPPPPVEEPAKEPEKPEVSPYQTILDAMEAEKPAEPEPPVVVEPQKPVYDPAKIEYRVQIRANIRQPMSKSGLENRFNIPASDIKEDRHNNYFIYTVGSFDTYEEARMYRDKLRRENGVHDAFVVAFQYGSRLPKLP